MQLYVDRFNRRDWDGVRELISADARLNVIDRMGRHGRRIDAEATKIWSSPKATKTIRDYVARTLGK